MSVIENFSKLTILQKLDILLNKGIISEEEKEILISNNGYSEFSKIKLQSENVISLLSLPYSIIPNVLVDNQFYNVPIVTEESSVVAAASKAAKFWAKKGGFSTHILSKIKKGHIYFTYRSYEKKLTQIFKQFKLEYFNILKEEDRSMSMRGGGLLDIYLLPKIDQNHNYYKIELLFDTCDAMGANYINTFLEKTSYHLKKFFQKQNLFTEIIMCILTNANHQCIVKCNARCKINEIDYAKRYDRDLYIKKLVSAYEIAKIDPDRAVTHNKGIMNGIVGLSIATGNDTRSIEANIHSYACKNNKYQPLSEINIIKDEIIISIKLPINTGIYGGSTQYTNITKISQNILNNPTIEQLMSISASVGLLSNFAAISSLITEGIQKGHMKLHNTKWRISESNR